MTGACIAALGLKIAGLFSNDEAFRKDLIAATRKTGERVWRLPMDDDFKEQLKSPVADLKNVGGKWGGAVTAAKFLEHFVGSTPWVHLDIAGPSWCDTENSTRDAGGTGCFVRTLVALSSASRFAAPRFGRGLIVVRDLSLGRAAGPSKVRPHEWRSRERGPAQSVRPTP